MSESEVLAPDAAPAPSPESSPTPTPQGEPEGRQKPRWLTMLVVGLVALAVLYGLTFPLLSYLKSAPEDPSLNAPVDISKCKSMRMAHPAPPAPATPATAPH